MIAWKVIREKDRTSCSMIRTSKYILTYYKDRKVKGIEGTLGIFCFKTKKDAKNFIKNILGWYNLCAESEHKIIKVKGLGKGVHAGGLISFFLDDEHIDNFYLPMHYIGVETRIAPPGTICFKSVEVLE